MRSKCGRDEESSGSQITPPAQAVTPGESLPASRSQPSRYHRRAARPVPEPVAAETPNAGNAAGSPVLPTGRVRLMISINDAFAATLIAKRRIIRGDSDSSPLTNSPVPGHLRRSAPKANFDSPNRGTPSARNSNPIHWRRCRCGLPNRRHDRLRSSKRPRLKSRQFNPQRLKHRRLRQRCRNRQRQAHCLRFARVTMTRRNLVRRAFRPIRVIGTRFGPPHKTPRRPAPRMTSHPPGFSSGDRCVWGNVPQATADSSPCIVENRDPAEPSSSPIGSGTTRPQSADSKDGWDADAGPTPSQWQGGSAVNGADRTQSDNGSRVTSSTVNSQPNQPPRIVPTGILPTGGTPNAVAGHRAPDELDEFEAQLKKNNSKLSAGLQIIQRRSWDEAGRPR